MYPQSGNSSRVTCISAKRRGLFHSATIFTDAHLHEFHPIDLLELIKRLKAELGHTFLENEWITSYLLQHNYALARATLRQWNLKAHFEKGSIEQESTLFKSDPIHSSFYSFVSLSKSDTDSRQSNFAVNIAYKLDLCEHESDKIMEELRQLVNNTNAKLHSIYAETVNMDMDNQDVVQAIELFRKCIGEVKETDRRSHRVQRNRLHKFIHKYLAKSERQFQLLHLSRINMQKAIRELLKLTETRKSLRGQMEFAELSQIKFDIRQLRIRLHQVEKGVLKLRKQILHVGMEKNMINTKLLNSKNQTTELNVSMKNVEELLHSYDTNYTKHQSEVEFWKNRVETTQNQMDTTIWPSIEDYMNSKMQLTSLDRLVATLQRVHRVEKGNMIAVQGKVKNLRTRAEGIVTKSYVSHEKWLQIAVQ